MQPVSPRIVDNLNEALAFELTVTNVYFVHARLLDSWGLTLLGKVFYDLSIDEMRDADALIQRVLMFDAIPIVGASTASSSARPRRRCCTWPSAVSTRPWPSSTPRRRSVTTSATTARRRCSKRWSARRSGTRTGSRAKSRPSSGSVPRRTWPPHRSRPDPELILAATPLVRPVHINPNRDLRARGASEPYLDQSTTTVRHQ